MDALAEAADHCLEPVWQVAVSGFTTTIDEVPTYVSGVRDPDEAINLTRSIVAAVLVPNARKTIESETQLTAAALAQARTRLIDHALARGQAASMAAEHEAAQVPRGTPNLDASAQTGEAPEILSGHAFRRPDDAATAAFCEAAVAGLDERSQKLVALRWQQGKTARETAAVFTCGAAAVNAHERRLRRQLQRGLTKRFARAFGPAALDRLLCGTHGQSSLPPITRERLRADILKRTFQSEPAPYGQRLRWGLAAAAVAFGVWLLMFVGVLPYYDDDVYPPVEVAVDCDGPCRAGGAATLSLLAPNDARFVAFMLTGADGNVRPLLTAPGGGVIALPFGARQAVVRMPYAAQWPAGISGPATVTAVFTAERVSPTAVQAVAAGDLGGALTSSTAVHLGSQRSGS